MEELEKNLDRNIGFINQADVKTAFSSTVLFAATGYAIEVVKLPQDPGTVLRLFLYVLWLLILCTFTFAAYQIYQGISPKTQSKIVDRTLIYFGDISQLTSKKFSESRMKLTPDELKNQLIDQIYITSIIASSKMDYARRALFSTGLYLVMIFVAALLGMRS